ncbi:MAG: hypothetical protein ACLSFJ_01170 [Holdemania filiformis]
MAQFWTAGIIWRCFSGFGRGPSLNLYLLCAEKQISRLPLRLAQNLRIRYILGPAAPAQLSEALERT